MAITQIQGNVVYQVRKFFISVRVQFGTNRTRIFLIMPYAIDI